MSQLDASHPLMQSDDCSICLCALRDDGAGHDAASAAASDFAVLLGTCVGHAFHKSCIERCIKNGSVRCPVCTTTYGSPQNGTQPTK